MRYAAHVIKRAKTYNSLDLTNTGQFVWICLRRKQDTHVIPEVYWSIVYFLLGNALDALAKFQTRGSRLFLCQMGRV